MSDTSDAVEFVVDIAYGRVAVSCKECGEEIASYEPGAAVDLDVINTDAEGAGHECEGDDEEDSTS